MSILDAMGPVEDDDWLEAEVQRELEALGPMEDGDEDKDHIISDSSSPDQDDAIDKARNSELDEYIKRMQKQAACLERELEECDELMQHTDRVSTRLDDQNDIALLAKERGMDTETFKRKVLDELDREDVEDEQVKLESVKDDWDNATEVKPTPRPADGVYPVSDNTDTPNTFLTGMEEQKTSEEEYSQLKKYFLGDDELISGVVVTKEMTDVVQREQVNEVEEPMTCNRVEPGKLTLNPGKGTIMSMVDPAALERRVMRDVLEWEVKWMKKNDKRQKELATIMSLEAEREEANAVERARRQKVVDEQQKELHLQQLAREEKLRREAEILQSQIEHSIEQYETEIGLLTESVRMESEVLLQVKEEGQKREEEKRERAALRMQALYRGYRVYKEKGLELKAHLEDWKQQKTEARIKAIDESRRKKAADKKRKEDEEQSRVEIEQRRKEEELKRNEEEKRKIEEEKLRKEEEKVRNIAEANRKKEEEEQKLEERRMEEVRKKESEKKRKEQEAIKQEEKQRKEEEEKRAEEEKKREKERLHHQKLKQEEEAKRVKEVARKKKEEAEQKKKEQEKRAQEERQRLEAEAAATRKETEKLRKLGIGMPHSPVPPDGRPNSPRKKINDLRRRSCDSNIISPLANGARSPPSSAGSPQSGPSLASDFTQLTAKALHGNLQPELSHGQNTPSTAYGDLSQTLPELIEKHRLEWITSCRPWSQTERELKMKSKSSMSTRKPLRRPISAKTAVKLPDDHVLRAAGASTLQSVTTVELHDLPGYSLKTLSQCNRLRTLRVNHCNTITTDGLSDCKQLVYLEMQHNALEMLNLRDLERLVYLDVSHNCLTAISGFEGCSSLRHLRAAHNRITRISGLEGLRCLHTLDMSHNQLITIKGLGVAPTLQEVHLSHNHLPAIDDLHHLGLLQVLKAASNNIIQPPVFSNHALLRHLVLDDNSLCSARPLTQSWLPLLKHLSMAQNSLTTVEDLKTCVSLQHLDVSNNQLLDVESIGSGLGSCRHLRHLRTDGNPAGEEPDFRSRIMKLVPSLVTVDGVAVAPESISPPVSNFEGMCAEQLIVWDKLTKQYTHVVRGASDLPSLSSVHVRYFTTSHSIAVEQRFAHEYGEVNATIGTDSMDMTFDLTPVPPGGTTQMKNKFELALQNVNSSNSTPVTSSQHTSKRHNDNCKSVRASHARRSCAKAKCHSIPGNPVQHAAATAIQALWRGYLVRRDTDNHKWLWGAATTIQAAWRGYFIRKVLREMGYFIGGSPDDRLHWAATIIQAVWRGHQVRNRITFALNYAHLSFDEDDIEEDLDFNEVDLSAFDFNEADLEKGWTPPETPQLPANHAVLGKPASTQQAADAKAAFDAAFNPQAPIQLINHQLHPPQACKQAWRNVDSPPSDPYMDGRPPLPPLSRFSDNSAPETQQTSETPRSHRSKKEEQLTEEWGFKDSRTAELMMQRAKKLKYNGARKKKISQLDPKQRLALFRKLEETTNIRTVQPPTKKILPRKEYFQAREEEVAHRAVEKQKEQVNHHRRTFEWIHTQVGNYQTGSDSRINQRLGETSQFNSEGNLPQMDAHVIAGARPNLTASPMSIELQSLDGVSTTSNMQRRLNSGGDPASRLPPIKVSSAPSARIVERMSIRNPKPKPTLESVGWGGGKKRSNRR